MKATVTEEQLEALNRLVNTGFTELDVCQAEKRPEACNVLNYWKTNNRPPDYADAAYLELQRWKQKYEATSPISSGQQESNS